MTSFKHDFFKFSKATAVLVIGSLVAAVCHWWAREQGDMIFTLFGYFSAVFAGMYYGLQVPDREAEKLKTKAKNQSQGSLSA